MHSWVSLEGFNCISEEQLYLTFKIILKYLLPCNVAFVF